LEFWYYVSDVTKLNDNNQVEIGSSGKPDANEYSWSLNGLSSGWNYIQLNISDAGKIGNPDLSAINWFRLYRFKSGGVTTRVDAIKLKGELSTSINDLDENQSVKIYPNPLKGNLLSIDLVGFNNQNNVDIKITNLLGQKVYSNTIYNKEHIVIDTNGLLNRGIYLISVKSGQSIITTKLINE